MESWRQAVKKAGFEDLIEAGLGGDMTTCSEAEEWLEAYRNGEKKTTSCCPGFVNMIRKHYPDLADMISTTVSPMCAVSRMIKAKDPDAVTVFVGPCVAKKSEVADQKIEGNADYALNYNEILAIMKAKDVELEPAENTYQDSTIFGKFYGNSGGVTDSVLEYMKETEQNEDIKVCKANGAAECKKALMFLQRGRCYMGNIDMDKLKAIENAMSQIEKQFGKGSVMKLGENSSLNIEAISTGCLDLDIALGVGGVPKGRIVEIYGPESSGKTTVALHIAAEAQKRGGAVAFIDAEHALDPSYARNLGVDTENLIVSQPDTGEQGLEIAEALVRSGAIDVIVVDSVAALVPRAEIDGEMGDSHVGLQARLMSQALRKLTGTIQKTGCVAIFINQLREKVGVMFGNPETTTGGRALKFYASIRLDVRRIDSIKQGESIVGNRTRVKVMKNKVAPPFKQAEFDIMYNEGISRTGNIVDVGVKEGIVQKSGAWFSYGDIRLGQGRENAKQYLKDNPETALDIENQIRSKYELPIMQEPSVNLKKDKEKDKE